MRELLEPMVNKLWYGKSIAWIVLWPFSVVFRGLSGLRRGLYRAGVKKTYAATVPVVVVGNLTVGGAGKTPMVMWLVRSLLAAGKKPGVLSRGYGGRAEGAHLVEPNSDVSVVGDEALMQARQLEVPVVVSARRAEGARLLSAQGVDLIICDDGLQHYALHRDFEIVMVDGDRGFGNGRMLPAGPLREPVSRLRSADVVITQRQDCAGQSECLSLTEPIARELNGRASMPLDEFPASRLHAVTGIGNPKKFFSSLRAAGFDVIEHAYPDHHQFVAAELVFDDDLPILITAKDAVKCEYLNCGSVWWIDVTPTLSEGTAQFLLQRILNLPQRSS